MALAVPSTRERLSSIGAHMAWDHRETARRERARARRGRERRRCRRGDRAGPRQGCARDQGRRRAPGPLGAPRRRRRDRDRHRSLARGARPDPPRRRPRDGDRGGRPLARDPGLDRAADRERLLLRLRVPGRLPPVGLRPRADRGRDGEARRRRRALRAHRRHAGLGDGALHPRGPALQGRADRGPRPRRGRRVGLALPQRALRGPLPRPARPLDRADRRLQAHLDRGGLLARRRDPADAHPDLRHRFLHREGPRGPPGADRAGEGARPPPPRSAARPVHLPPGGARDAVLAAERDRAPAHDRGRGAKPAPQARLQRDQDAAGARRGALAPLGPLRQLPREHVLHRARRARAGERAPLRPAADELPWSLPRLRLGPAFLPRPAAAARGVRTGLPLRARGRPARPAAGPFVHAGRRPRLLHDRTGARRGDRHRRGDRRAVLDLRVRRRARRALDPPGEVDRHRRGVGRGDAGARGRARQDRPAATR